MQNVNVKIEQKVAILIDGNNLEMSIHKMFGDKSKMINYDLLVPEILMGRSLSRLIYFREGKSISEKFTKRIHRNFFGIVKPCYKSVDIPLTIEAVQMADKVDTIIICSGDVDYAELVKHLKGRGLRVEIASVQHSTSQYLTDIADSHHKIEGNMCFDFKQTTDQE